MSRGGNRKTYHQENEADMLNLVDNINRKDDEKYSRRAFLKTCFGASVALALATMPFSVQALMEQFEDQFDIQKIAAVDDIPVGGSYQFKYPTEDDKALIVRLSADRFVAYNNACTHLSCPVYWDKKREDLVCPCHQGYFDVQTGHPVAGPPQRELPKIELLVENGEIYAVGRKIRHG